MKYRGRLPLRQGHHRSRRRDHGRGVLQLLDLLEARLVAVVRAARPDEAHGRVGAHHVHVQQTRHQTSLLQALRRPAVRRRHRSRRATRRPPSTSAASTTSSSTRCRCITTTAERSERTWTDSYIYAPAWPDSWAWRSGHSRRMRSRRRLTPDMLAVFETGVRYQMYHVFALFAAAWGWARWQRGRSRSPAGCLSRASPSFPAACICSRSPVTRWLGAITPLGGLAFLAGWLCLAWGAATKMRA